MLAGRSMDLMNLVVSRSRFSSTTGVPTMIRFAGVFLTGSLTGL